MYIVPAHELCEFFLVFLSVICFKADISSSNHPPSGKYVLLNALFPSPEIQFSMTTKRGTEREKREDERGRNLLKSECAELPICMKYNGNCWRTMTTIYDG